MKKISEFLASSCLVVLGIAPSLAFLVWIERNMALPWIGTWIGWPWVYVEGGIAAAIGFNLGLIAIFGFLHSALIGRLSRRAYVIVAGISAFFVMAGWQSTGVILYQLIPSAVLGSLVSLVVYWGVLAGWGALAFAFRPSADARSSGPFWTRGLYPRVRHPLYALAFAAWILTPMMSLDRFVFVAGMAVYLAIGIRREERRLLAEFGEAYADYRARTPMLVPRRR